MSFLDSVLSSLQSGKPSQPPLYQQPAPPVSFSAQQKDVRMPVTASRSPALNSKSDGGAKRKADEQLPRPSKIGNHVSGKPPPTKSGIVPSSKPVTAKSGQKSASASSNTASPKPTTATSSVASSRPPPKGSYADLMMQAKAMQDKAPANLGQLRHQPVAKEKGSFIEYKRLRKEAKSKRKIARSGEVVRSPTPKNKTGLKKSDSAEPSYKGTARSSASLPERPPLYRGTAGLPGSRRSNERRVYGKRRMNEYLGTDEEDEGDYGGYNEYYSDVSSDMEAGFDDVEQEEGVALKSARKEDEEELRLEMIAKKQKMERQKKLAALASRNKR